MKRTVFQTYRLPRVPPAARRYRPDTHDLCPSAQGFARGSLARKYILSSQSLVRIEWQLSTLFTPVWDLLAAICSMNSHVS